MAGDNEPGGGAFDDDPLFLNPEHGGGQRCESNGQIGSLCDRLWEDRLSKQTGKGTADSKGEFSIKISKQKAGTT